jgi:bacterioferritin (cytochrome b1)
MDYKKQIESLNKTLETSIDSMKAYKNTIESVITPELMGSMSAIDLELIKKSKEMLTLDLSNPDKVLKSQKELISIMESASIYAHKEAVKNKPKT